MQTEKFICRSVPASASSQLDGSRQRTTIASPAAVYAIRSRHAERPGRPAPSPIVNDRDAEDERHGLRRVEPGEREQRAERHRDEAADPPPLAPLLAGGSGRFRIAVTMFSRLTRQAETTDDDEGQQHADRVRDDMLRH